MIKGSLTRAHVTGAVYGHTNVGGLIGSLKKESDNDLNGATISISYASGSVAGAFEVGGLIGSMETGTVSNVYADGSIHGDGAVNVGGLIGLMKSGEVSNSYAAKISMAASAGSSGGLIAKKEGGAVNSGFYLASGGLADNGIGEAKTLSEMVSSTTYGEDWNFDTIWQLDERAGYPQLVGLETLAPAIRGVVVRDEEPDVLEIAFYEPVVIDENALDHLKVTVDGKAVSFTGATDTKQRLLLTLDGAIAPLQTVKVMYDSAYPIADRSGNMMASITYAAENLVTSSLKFESVSPANGTKNVSTKTNLTLTYSSTVTPVAGKTITIRKLFSGKAVETISVTDTAKVRVSGTQVTVNPATDLSEHTAYYVQMESGAFKDAEDNRSIPVNRPNVWQFETGADAGKQWINAASGLTNAKGENPSLHADGDTLYVAYSDKSRDGKLTVMKLGKTDRSWQPVGSPGFTAGEAELPSLYVDNGIPYVAFKDGSSNGKATVMKYDDAWSTVGSAGLSEGEIDDPSLVVDNGIPYLAYRDFGQNQRVVVMKYDSDWHQVGSLPVSANQGYRPSLRIHEGTPHVAYVDHEAAAGFGGTVMQYDKNANTWNAVGERGFTPDNVYETRLFVDDGKWFVAYKNIGWKAEVMMYDETGNKWNQVGPAGFSADQVTGIDLFVNDGDPHVVYQDLKENNNEIAVMKYSGTGWVQLGESLGRVSEGVSASPSLAFVNGVPHVAFVNDDGSLFVKKYAATAGSGGGSPTGPDDRFKVIVDGKEQGNIAKRTESEQEGRKTVTVTVDTSKLIDLLNDAQGAPVVLIPVSGQTDRVSAVLTAEAVKAMENKQAVLIVETENGNYRLPAADLLIEQAAAAFGEQVNLEDIVVTIEVAKGSEGQAGQLRQIAEKSGFSIVVPPVGFTVKLSHAGTDLEIERFAAFVQREIPIPAGMDPSAVTTAVVLEKDGTVRHVPTYIMQRDGVWYAVVNSLTNSAYTLVYYEAHFSDLDGHWAKPAVLDMASRKIVSGVGGGRFLPDAPVSRAEFAALLVRALGLPEGQGAVTFTDVKATDWFAGSVATAAEYGLVKGYTDGAFRPSDKIAREAAMAMIARAMELAGMDPVASGDSAEAVLSAFSDGRSVSPWAKQAVAYMLQHGVVTGSAAGLKPQDTATRAEAVVFIQRMLRAANLIN